MSELTAEQKKKLIRLLQEIVRYADLEALALVTRTGMSIAFFAEKSDADPDLFSALSAAVLATGGMVTQRMSHGDLWEVLVRGENGYTILASAGEHILIGASREAHSLGLAIRVLRRYAQKIPQIFAKEDKDIGDLVKDLRSLLNQ
ncbi:MAG: roadblock/LC7 domain-containing protein [Candidatus Hodarchaeota archaeon]